MLIIYFLDKEGQINVAVQNHDLLPLGITVFFENINYFHSIIKENGYYIFLIIGYEESKSDPKESRNIIQLDTVKYILDTLIGIRGSEIMTKDSELIPL
jgi:hypothetical protein